MIFILSVNLLEELYKQEKNNMNQHPIRAKILVYALIFQGQSNARYIIIYFQA